MSKFVIKKETGSILSSEGLPIAYDLYTPAVNGYAIPVVLFLHGFKGFKDWGPFPDACFEIAENGYAVVSFNLSLSGIGANPTEFDRLDLFARDTLSQDQEDIKSVLNALRSKEISSGQVDFDLSRIGLIGHSRGGHSAVVAAANYEEINCLVTWSAVASYIDFWSDEMVNDWKTKGYTDILNSRTKQLMRVDKIVYDDAVENADKLMALNRVKQLHIPVCFIHGKTDEAVPYQNADLLYENCPSFEKRRIIVPNAGHTYGGVHPFEAEELPETFNELLSSTLNWFDANL